VLQEHNRELQNTVRGTQQDQPQAKEPSNLSQSPVTPPAKEERPGPDED
jgi:hypothetical protein